MLTHCAHTHLLYIRSQFPFFTIWFGEKNKLQEHQSDHGIEGEKKEEKTKANAFMEVVYDLCGKTKTLACLFIEGK
jgi:hypothetical protein